MTICPFCHFQNEDGALFCEQCKSDLSGVAATPTAAPAAAVPVMAEPVLAVPGAPPVAAVPVMADEAEAVDAVMAEPVQAIPLAAEPYPMATEAVPLADEPVAAEPVAAEPLFGEPYNPEPLKPTIPEPVAAAPPPPPAVEAPPPPAAVVAPIAAAPADGDGPRLPAGAQPRLLVLRGQKPKAEYPIYEGQNFIGRSDEKPVDIDLEEQEPPDRIWCSRQHALLTLENDTLTVEDLNSSNGTFVNRARIYPAQPKPLAVNDIIQIGNVQMKVVV